MGRKFSKEHKKWREKIIFRDKGCVVCGKPPPYLNAHHIIPSLFHKYEFLPDNGITLCPHCHTLGKWSAHKNPLWFAQWMRINYSELFFLAMQRLENEVR